MKQQITRENWQELSLGQQRKFQEALGHGDFPHIGDLIEFIYKHDTVEILSEERESPIGGWSLDARKYESMELIDALWMWVKNILNRK